MAKTKKPITDRVPTNAKVVGAAQRLYNHDSCIQVDDHATVSRGEGNPDWGAYVQAWVWVPDFEAYRRPAKKG